MGYNHYANCLHDGISFLDWAGVGGLKVSTPLIQKSADNDIQLEF